MKSIRVLIADDHPLVRSGLRGALGTMNGVEIVGEAANGLDAVKLVESLEPDIVMTDISMPGLDGLGVTAAVVKGFPKTRVLILSMYTEGSYAENAIKSGAAGYLIKDSEPAEVETALKAVAQGGIYLSPSVTKVFVTEFNRKTEDKAGEPVQLTPRQSEILKLIAQGYTTKAIARVLGIAIKTVETHRTQLMERLKVHDVTGLVRYAIKHGIIDGSV